MHTDLLTAYVKEKLEIRDVAVKVYKIPTDQPESDGTLKWSSTTMVVVELHAGNKTGLGYSYAHESTAKTIQTDLCELLVKRNVMDIPAIVADMKRVIRNQGMAGISMMAVSAVDIALWDLKAKVLDLPLCTLLGQRSESMLVYGSGGFTSYSVSQLEQDMRNWRSMGLKHVKMKVGRKADQDVRRVKAAREALGTETEIFVDANGAYSTKEALYLAERFADQKVTWFEEPVSSDNVEGMRTIKQKAPPPIRIAAGEYGYNPEYFKRFVAPQAVDVLQADATRCGGISGFMEIGLLCDTMHVPFSSHCAPSVHLHAAVSLPEFLIAEYFHDHVRIENMLFEGHIKPENGQLEPNLTLPGLGIQLKEQDAEKYKLN